MQQLLIAKIKYKLEFCQCHFENHVLGFVEPVECVFLYFARTNNALNSSLMQMFKTNTLHLLVVATEHKVIISLQIYAH